MEQPLPGTDASSEPRQAVSRRSCGRTRLLLQILGAGLLVYLLTAYVALPLLWKRDVARHPALFNAPRITHTVDGIPGDPVNLALLGSEADLIRGLTRAKWYPADPITFRSSMRIALDSVLRRPDDDAPVSTLRLFARKQDLAFEQPVGGNPRQRHHVRFWRWDRLEDGREVWFGAATYDERVGLSHTTGQITHHIGPDVDAERDRILSQLREANQTSEVYWAPGFHTELEGKNGGGDPWRTDGRLGVAVLIPHTNAPPATTPTTLPR
jgi:hypothetical protein